MILSTHGIVGSQIVQIPPTGILADYPGAAAAYSLRQLTTAYTGNAIRVRRASDNTEQNIGFVDGELDTSSLISFCSGTDGFVTTWYDQSGNSRNATQTTAANQPQIVSSGSVINLNSKPAAKFDGSNDALTNAISIINTTNPKISVYSVLNKTSTGSFSSPFMIGTVAGNFYFPHRSNSITDEIQFRANGANSVTINSGVNYTNTQQLLSTSDDGSNILIYRNNTSIINGTSSLGIFSESVGYNIGAVNGSALGLWTGNIQELIIYPSDQSSNRSGIETNINDFYSIY